MGSGRSNVLVDTWFKMKCPQCDSQVTQEAVCPGYRDPSDGRWFQCYPACGNGTLYECSQIVCGWWFIDGMNRANTLFEENEQRRPLWLN